MVSSMSLFHTRKYYTLFSNTTISTIAAAAAVVGAGVAVAVEVSAVAAFVPAAAAGTDGIPSPVRPVGGGSSTHSAAEATSMRIPPDSDFLAANTLAAAVDISIADPRSIAELTVEDSGSRLRTWPSCCGA